MKRKTTLFIVFFILSLQGVVLYAQNYTQRKEFRMANSHWFTRALESGKMFDMRTSPPTTTLLPKKLTIGECGTGVSDTATGDLLFYSNGIQIFNRNHEVMPNGDSLVPIASNLHENTSTAQQVCIVPIIDFPEKFYVFLLQPNEAKQYGVYGLYYCIVDMSLGGGLGDVVPGSVTRLYDKPMHEGMVAVPGNNCDVWVLVHPSADSNFMAYHITSEGLNKTPVVSSPGLAIYDDNYSFDMGGLAVSPQRDKIAISSYSMRCEMIETDTVLITVGDTMFGGVMVAKFDAETGKVSEGLKVDHYSMTHTLAFSPNGNLLYFSSVPLDTTFYPNAGDRGLLQYDLSKYSLAEIRASRYKVSMLPSFLYGFRMRGDTIVLSDYTYIASPDSLQAQCDYNMSRNYLIPNTPYSAGFSLGNDVVYPLPATHIVNVKDTTVCSNVTLSATAGYYHYRWNTGLEEATLALNGSGTYWVEYEKNCHTGVDTFHVEVVDFIEPMISVNEHDLSTTQSYDTYQWMLDGEVIPSATSRVYTVKVNGAYQVIASKGDCIDTSAPYQVNNATDITDLNNEMSVHIYPNPASTVIYIDSPLPVDIAVIGVEGKVYKKAIGQRVLNIQDLADGLYIIEVKNREGGLLQVQKLIKSSR